MQLHLRLPLTTHHRVVRYIESTHECTSVKTAHELLIEVDTEQEFCAADGAELLRSLRYGCSLADVDVPTFALSNMPIVAVDGDDGEPPANVIPLTRSARARLSGLGPFGVPACDYEDIRDAHDEARRDRYAEARADARFMDEDFPTGGRGRRGR